MFALQPVSGSSLSVKSEAEAVTEKLMEALKQHISVSITADDFSEALRRLFANKAASN